MTREHATNPPSGSYRAPRLTQATVGDAMRMGVLTCPRSASLGEVARTMTVSHVHCVVVDDLDGEDRPWGIVSDLDLVVAALAGAGEQTAGESAATEVRSVRRSDPLEDAARAMTEHELHHLIVVDDGGRPVGVLSTLDVAGTIAWGEA